MGESPHQYASVVRVEANKMHKCDGNEDGKKERKKNENEKRKKERLKKAQTEKE